MKSSFTHILCIAKNIKNKKNISSCNIDAPKHISVHREEIYQKILIEQSAKDEAFSE